MSTQPPPTPEIVLFPEWVAAALYFAVIPLGLLVGYLAFRGFRRTNRRKAQLLAVGLVLLTAVDTALGTSLDIGGVVDLPQAPLLARGVVQLLGVAAILYAMYRPTRPAVGRPDRTATDQTGDRSLTESPTDGTEVPESREPATDETADKRDGESK